MFGLGAGELLLIFVIALLFLGPKKLPELAKGLGQAMREFQKARENVMDELNNPPQNAAKKIEGEVVASTESQKEEKAEETKPESQKLS